MDVNRVGLFSMVIQVDNGSLSNGHSKRHSQERTQIIQPSTFEVSFNLSEPILNVNLIGFFPTERSQRDVED